MPNFNIVGGLFAAAIEEWGTRLVAIPARYAIGAWIGTLIAHLAALDREARTDLRDLIGVAGWSRRNDGLVCNLLPRRLSECAPPADTRS